MQPGKLRALDGIPGESGVPADLQRLIDKRKEEQVTLLNKKYPLYQATSPPSLAQQNYVSGNGWK
jgi:hypothetical protein